ncbi:putative protein phosphatase 2C 58, partial [Cucurbita argyrosperma subsp. argyrosperma]
VKAGFVLRRRDTACQREAKADQESCKPMAGHLVKGKKPNTPWKITCTLISSASRHHGKLGLFLERNEKAIKRAWGEEDQTAVTCHIGSTGHKPIVANVGDSEPFFAKDGVAEPALVDHDTQEVPIKLMSCGCDVPRALRTDIGLFARAFGVNKSLKLHSTASEPDVKSNGGMKSTEFMILVAEWQFWKVMTNKEAVES